MHAGTRIVLALLLAPTPLGAQGFLEQFSYEGLRFAGIGFDLGMVASDRLTSEPTGSLWVDYGFIAPNVRVALRGSYFRGRFSQSELDRFETRLRELVTDPTGDFTIDVGDVTWTDIGGTLDLQYLFNPGDRVRPYLGLGLGVHLRDGDGPAIRETFVEDALDTITAGAIGSMGLEVALTRGLLLTADVRGELTSELRTMSARGGLLLLFPGGAR